jgi:hypothetical protein
MSVILGEFLANFIPYEFSLIVHKFNILLITIHYFINFLIRL